MSKESNPEDKELTNIVDLNQYKFDQIEKELRVKLTEFTENQSINYQIGEAFYIWKNNPNLIPEDLLVDEIDESTFSRFFDWFLYDFKLIDTGKTVIATFYEENKEDLSPIEKTIINEAKSSVCSFYLLEDISDGQECLISDIFTNKKYKVIDKSTARKAKPYNILGARILHSDKSLFFSDVITIYPLAFKSLILEFYKNEFEEFKKTVSGKPTVKNFLKHWGYLIFQYLENISSNPRFITSEGLEFVFSSSEYEVIDFDKVINTIENISNFTPLFHQSSDMRVYSITSENNEIAGLIEMDKDNMNLECYSNAIHDYIKDLFDSELSDSLFHKKDITRDINSIINTESRNATQKVDRLPPGVSNKDEIDTILDEYYTEWMDVPMDILDGQTPREASESPEGKKQLQAILTELEDIYTVAKNRGEPYYNVNILRNKLNL